MSRLTSLSVSNFRSVAGKALVPLDASIVLLHGPNGIGKTSILSALELALAGDVSSLRRLDKDFERHLVHRGAPCAEIVVEGLLPSGTPIQPRTIRVTPGGTLPQALLPADGARFFSERCYLPQATLGRLLEVYQFSTASEDSHLTRFVKDLLRIDRLEAIINGLYPLGHVRRVEKLVPEYRVLTEQQRQLESDLERLTSEQGELLEKTGALENELVDILRAVAGGIGDVAPPIVDMQRVISFLLAGLEEDHLVGLARHRREVAAATREWEVLSAEPRGPAPELEARLETAANAVRSWTEGPGRMLTGAIAALERLAGRPLGLEELAGPLRAREAAVAEAVAIRDQCRRTLEGGAKASARLAELDELLRRSRGRLALIDEQMRSLTTGADGLASVLAAVLPHLIGEECPVCGRDYREVSQESLSTRVANHVARLTDGAAKLQALAAERREAAASVSQSERERETVAISLLSPDSSQQLAERTSTLNAIVDQLNAMSSAAEDGERLITAARQLQAAINAARGADVRVSNIFATADRVSQAMGLPPRQPTDATASTLERIRTHIQAEERKVEAIQVQRRKGLELVRQLDTLAKRNGVLSKEMGEARQGAEAARAAHAAVERRRKDLREVAKAASDVRVALVRSVFGDSLNRVWGELFTRLAPSEQFVPAFAIPEEQSSEISALLETVHRSGDRSGTPGAILSSGNLNTAALTLFLALHLVVKPQLPWLILDDPIQSMDDVHISQFAALLRTIVREHNRQVVMAVHDRALFDYLMLELSPSEVGERLIGVELSSSADGTTLVNPMYQDWKAETAIVAA